MNGSRTVALPILLVLFASAGCARNPRAASLAAAEPLEFAEASFILERNVTDQDAEVVVIAKGLDEGLRRLRILNDAGVVILDLTAGTSSSRCPKHPGSATDSSGQQSG